MVRVLRCRALSALSALPEDHRIASIWKSWRRSMATCPLNQSQLRRESLYPAELSRMWSYMARSHGGLLGSGCVTR